MADDNVVHRTADHSFWNGWITALCGAEAEYGEYTTDTFSLLLGPPCQPCERIYESGDH
ncbi:hypothetical protein ACFWY9_29740 [Amycolatopsis sp. NPDC059027]|uniref:hypothetical protein n=1 Tax=Amycolatopsis sp. NPDC059027 TaxID=3346709 RepID=UPI00366FE665